MVKSSTAAKAILTVIVVAGFTVTYALAGVFTALRILTLYGLLFWLGVVLSVVLFIWRVLPRWLIAFGWTSLAVYLFVYSGWPPELSEIYLVIVLSALFLILLAKWIHDVRRVKGLARNLDQRTLAELKRLEGTIAETRGASQAQSPRGATTQALLRLDPATMQALGDVANLGRQMESDRNMGFPMDWNRILASINELETRMAVRGVRRSWVQIGVTAADILIGGGATALLALVYGLFN